MGPRHLALVLLAAVTLLSAPPAHAQGVVCGVVSVTCQTSLELAIAPPTEPLEPLGGFVALPVQVRYSFYDIVPSTFSATRVDLAVTDLSPWATASLSPTSVMFPMDGVPCACVRVMTGQVFLLVSVGPDAPAFTQGLVEVDAQARENGFHGPSEARVQVPIQADFFALTEARLPMREVALAPGGSVMVPMTVGNFGNALVRVAFSVDGAPRGVQVTPPEPMVLASKAMGGDKNHKATAWTVRADSAFDAGDAVLVLRTTYALDPSVQGDEVRLPLHVARDPDGGLGVQSMLGPGFPTSPLGMGLLAAGLAGSVMFEMHRRRRAS